MPILLCVFNKSLEIGYCPRLFKKSIAVVLRKPGKDDYAAPKSYRPVALINTIGKVLDTVLVTEKHHMLPTIYTGGRKQSLCKYAIHLFTAWM
jgi:hypothetical protein